MSSTITYNIEIEEGGDTLEVFNVKDSSTGLPQNLTGAVVEVQISFETLPKAIVFRSDINSNLLVGGLLGTIRLTVPWVYLANTNYNTGSYNLYIRYPNGLNILQYKGFVTIVRGTVPIPVPGTTIPDPSLPSGDTKGPLPVIESTSVVLATDHPTINVSSVAGLGTLGLFSVCDLGEMPDKAVGARLYLGPGDSVSFTIADEDPEVPDCVFTLSLDTTGPNWDENLSSGQMMYITQISGTPKFRWI
jgi:hypothetical protein